MIRGLLVLVAAGALFATSWFVLPVWGVWVSGTHHLDPDRVTALAHASAGEPWLWVTRARAARLLDDPWVQSVSVERRFPGRVRIMVVERTPVAVFAPSGQPSRVVAQDGASLPGAPKPRLSVSGWGGACPGGTSDAACLQRALDVARLFKRLGVSSVAYSPTGFTCITSTLEVWSDSVTSLRRHGGGVTMVASLSPVGSGVQRPNPQSGKFRVRVNVYPWGVSVQE